MAINEPGVNDSFAAAVLCMDLSHAVRLNIAEAETLHPQQNKPKKNPAPRAFRDTNVYQKALGMVKRSAE